jgi:hypothetical protein
VFVAVAGIDVVALAPVIEPRVVSVRKLVSHRPMPAPQAAVSSMCSLEARCASACFAASMSSVTPMTSTGRPDRSHSTARPRSCIQR